MRKKDEILNDSIKTQASALHWGSRAVIHELLTIEVLIDIRDQLNSLYDILSSVQNISFRPR